MHRTLLACAALAAAAATSAQTLKPGLWEITNQMQGAAGSKMDAAMAQMQKQMAAMSPEQRKMMEDMMAKQGIKMDAGAGTSSIQLCLTAEMIARNDVTPPEGDCKQTSQSRTGNTLTFSYACTQPPSSGNGQVVFVSPEAYTMSMQVKSKAAGKEQSMTVASSGQFLSAECGAIKPLSVPTK